MALTEEQKNQIIGLYNLDHEKVFVTGSGYDDQILTMVEKLKADTINI